ncbi:DUF3761 domain-containing protein [Patescibacteria group bacterium]|nr:DUF3761 domain-containing protein [Patescibacteria group bacterium]
MNIFWKFRSGLVLLATLSSIFSPFQVSAATQVKVIPVKPVQTIIKPTSTKAANPKAVPVKPSPVAPRGTYTNVNGNKIRRPYVAPITPAGASAQCRDNTFSFSQNRRGTCSGHGGVMMWY